MRTIFGCVTGAVFAITQLAWLDAVSASTSPLVVDLYRDTTTSQHVPRAERRQVAGAVPLSLTNPYPGYSAVLQFGTPAVAITLGLTALSSDTWVNVANSTFCSNSSNGCATYGLYNPANSSTSHWEADDFSSSYGSGIGTIINGSWFSDTVEIGTFQFDNAQFAVANQSYVNEGFLGLGYSGLETASTKYPNFPYLLYQQNDIECVAWSIWLDPVDQSSGQLIFGGIDSTKFFGSLETYSVQPTGVNTYTQPYIQLTDLRLVYNGANESLTGGKSLTIMPDAGESFSFVPPIVFENLINAFNASSYPTYNTIQYCSCELLSNSTTLDFIFDSTHGPIALTLPMNEIVANDSNSCYLMFIPENDTSQYILGANFLRSTYVVYDFLHNEVSMAPSNNETSSQVIQAIPSAGVAAAAFQGVATTSASKTSAGPTKTGSPFYQLQRTPPSGLSTGAKAGIGVGAAVGALLLLAVGFLLFRQRGHHKPAAPEVESTAPTRQQSEKYSFGNNDVTVVEAPMSAPHSPRPLGAAINWQRQELATGGQEQHQRLQDNRESMRPLSDVSGSDQYASTVVASSPHSPNNVYELTTDGAVMPQESGIAPGNSIKRKPVGS